MTSADDAIRQAFDHAATADPVVDPSNVAEAVRAGAARPGPKGPGPRRLGWPVLGALGLAGLLVGGGVGLVTKPSDAATATAAVRRDRAPMAACPGGGPIGWFHAGDGVLAVARSADGAFVAVRSPRDREQRVWVGAGVLTTDGDLRKLPVDGCGDEGELALGEIPPGPVATLPAVPVDTTTSVPGSTDDTTTVPGDTTTTVPGQVPSVTAGPVPVGPAVTTGPTNPPVTTTPPPPADTTGPALGAANANPPVIYEDSGTCAADTPNNPRPRTAAISVGASDPSGIASVSMSWSRKGIAFADKGGQTSRAMSPSGGAYVATLGPFGGITVDTTIAVRVTARDNRGNTSTTTVNVVLKDCFFG